MGSSSRGVERRERVGELGGEGLGRSGDTEDDVPEQRLLVPELVVDGLLARRAAGRRDLLGPRRLVALSQEQLGRGADDRGAFVPRVPSRGLPGEALGGACDPHDQDVGRLGDDRRSRDRSGLDAPAHRLPSSAIPRTSVPPTKYRPVQQ